jgi:alpha-galactosidase
VHRLAFRAATALFGHFGIEWDVAGLGDDERAELASWVALYKAERDLLHRGRVVRGDHPDPSLWLHGVVSQQRDRALFAAVQLATSPTAVPLPVRLPGLDPGRRYRIEVVGGDDTGSRLYRRPGWTDGDAEPVVTGAALGRAGIALPTLPPESAVVLRVFGA